MKTHFISRVLVCLSLLCALGLVDSSFKFVASSHANTADQGGASIERKTISLKQLSHLSKKELLFLQQDLRLTFGSKNGYSWAGHWLVRNYIENRRALLRLIRRANRAKDPEARFKILDKERLKIDKKLELLEADLLRQKKAYYKKNRGKIIRNTVGKIVAGTLLGKDYLNNKEGILRDPEYATILETESRIKKLKILQRFIFAWGWDPKLTIE